MHRTRGSGIRSRKCLETLSPGGFGAYHGIVSSVLPGADQFTTPVYGTVFGRRTQVVHRLHQGDRLILVPDPPGTIPQWVWVHAPGGDPVGHLSPDVSSWLAPAMLDGGCYAAQVTAVHGDEVASWKRLTVTVRRVRMVRSA